MSSPTHCDLCGGGNHDLMFNLTDRLYGRGGSFPLVRCQDCGLLFINPRPGLDELKSYYPQEDYDLYARAAGLKDRTAGERERLFGPRKRKIEKYRGGGRILDIGFGDGSFLQYMKQSGWDVAGVDFNERAVELARREHGIDAVAGEVQDARYESGAFDVVTLWGVVEHTQSPRETLAEIGRITGGGALLVIYTQNAAAPEARWLGQDWFIYEAPRHLYSFDTKSLARLLAAGGFSVSEIVFETPLFYCQMNWQYFKERRLKRKNDVVHNPTIVDRLMVKLLSFYRKAVGGRRWSSAMTVYAVKREPAAGGKPAAAGGGQMQNGIRHATA